MSEKICEACEKKIGETDKVCPNPECGVDLEQLEEEIKVVTRARTIAEKRAKKTEATPAPAPTPTATKKSVFRSLSLKGKK